MGNCINSGCIFLSTMKTLGKKQNRKWECFGTPIFLQFVLYLLLTKRHKCRKGKEVIM